MTVTNSDSYYNLLRCDLNKPFISLIGENIVFKLHVDHRDHFN